MVRLMCDKPEDYKWTATDVVDAVLNKFYIVSNCGSCGSYWLDVSFKAATKPALFVSHWVQS